MVPTTIGNNQQTNDGAASAGRGAHTAVHATKAAKAPTEDESHLSLDEHAAFERTAEQLQECCIPDCRTGAGESANQLDVLINAAKQLSSTLASKELQHPAPEDKVTAVKAGRDLAKGEHAHQLLLSDVADGNVELSISAASPALPTFEAMDREVESRWPDNFADALKSALLAHLTEIEKIYLVRTTVNAIEAMEIPRAVHTMVSKILEVVCTVRVCLPDISTRGADFPLANQMAEELAEKDQQITHLEDSGQAVSVLALQGQKRDLLVDHLKDLKDIAMQHDNALQKVCSARAVTLNVVGDTISQALEECEETLGAFFAKIQEQKAVTHTRKKVLQAVLKQSTARSNGAQQKLVADSVRAMEDAVALTSGSTGSDLVTIIRRAGEAVKRQAEATANCEKLRLTTGGYSAEMTQAVADTEALQTKQDETLATVTLLQEASVGLGAIFTKTASSLVDTSGHWETMVGQSRTRVRRTIEQLVCTLFRWITVVKLTPALKKEAMTCQQVKIKQHAMEDEKETVDLDDPSSFHAAIAAVEEAKAVHSQQVDRVAAARLELSAVLVEYDYKELRGLLTDAGVKLGADPSAEPEPDVSSFVKRSLGRLMRFLALTN